MAAPTRFETIRAFAVHVFTACGAALAFLALGVGDRRTLGGDVLLPGLALVVDGADGPLAREFKVAEVLPRWSGETLDLIVDFTTYVFVPAYAIAASGHVAEGLAVPAGIVVVITGALYFADRNMKTPDNYFRGFPGLWNLAAFYLYLLEPPEWASAAMVAALAVLTFLPLKFLHPLRVKRLRALNIALLAVWAVLAFIAVMYDLAPGPFVVVAAGRHRVLFFRRRPVAHARLIVLVFHSEVFGRWPCHDLFF